MLWMKVRDLTDLPMPENLRVDETITSQLGCIDQLCVSILNNGWVESSQILIVDGKIATGWRRMCALRQLLSHNKITSDFMVAVRVQRTMLVPTLVDVL